MSRFVRWWRSYWLAPGGRYATAVLRIAIASSLLWMLWQYATVRTPGESPLYYKLGIWMLYPGRPGPGLLHALGAIAWVSTALMLIGAWSRASHAVSLIAMMAIAAHGVSDSPTWSHTDVPPILASFALLGARSGEVWAVDAWRRKRRAEIPPPALQTSVRLVQLAVAAVFATAALAKLKAGGFGLGWAFSDSLRNHLLVRFDWIHLPRTPLANWLMQSSTRWEAAALLNLVSQLTPLATLALMHRPGLRALAGLCFVAEVLGLGFVMGLWNLHWLPLAVVFIDWDALIAPSWNATPELEPSEPEGSVVWPTLFVAFFALNALWLNQRLRAFPFSSFPMFSQVRAKAPYGTHQTYELVGGHFEVRGEQPVGEFPWLDGRGTYRFAFKRTTCESLREAVTSALTEVRSSFDTALPLTEIRYWLSRYQAPAYPALARLDRTDLAVLASLTVQGELTCFVGSTSWPAGTRFFVQSDLAQDAVELPGPPPPSFGRFYVQPPSSALRYVVRQ